MFGKNSPHNVIYTLLSRTLTVYPKMLLKEMTLGREKYSIRLSQFWFLITLPMNQGPFQITSERDASRASFLERRKIVCRKLFLWPENWSDIRSRVDSFLSASGGFDELGKILGRCVRATTHRAPYVTELLFFI